MRSQQITQSQHLINQINARQDFTFPLKTKRYVVGINNLHASKNPSINFTESSEVISESLHKLASFNNNISDNISTLGGWLDQDTNIYHIDEGISTSDLDKALDLAVLYNQKAIYDSYKDKVININSQSTII